jgi:hypothetical protein
MPKVIKRQRTIEADTPLMRCDQQRIHGGEGRIMRAGTGHGFMTQ